MLQTVSFDTFEVRYDESFKSPRECYKLIVIQNIKRIAEIVFQVPKGMLQTNGTSAFRRYRERVSSPQGNATN